MMITMIHHCEAITQTTPAIKKASEKIMTITMIHHREAIAQITRKNLINDPHKILEKPKIKPNHLGQEKTQRKIVKKDQNSLLLQFILSDFIKFYRWNFPLQHIYFIQLKNTETY